MKKLFDAEIAKTAEIMVAMPWEDRSFYRSYLTQTYYFVAHSTRLLALAAGCVKTGEDSLHRRFSAHIGEEKGHDKLALHDLKQLGREALQAEEPATRNLYETQYYKIQHIHSSALFGYILALEGVASLICPKFIQRIYQSHGVETARFLKLHVEEDPDHVEKAFEEIEKLGARDKEVIETNLKQSFLNYRQFMQGVLLAADKPVSATWALTEDITLQAGI